jgi:hypothetical protein
MAIQKASLFSSLLEHWCRLSGEIHEPGAGLQVSVSPLAPPIQAQPKVGEWIELYERGVISREELRQQLALVTASSVSPVHWALAMVKPQIAMGFALPLLARGQRLALATGVALLSRPDSAAMPIWRPWRSPMAGGW